MNAYREKWSLAKRAFDARWFGAHYRLGGPQVVVCVLFAGNAH